MTPEAIARLGFDVAGLKKDAAEVQAIYDKIAVSIEKLEGVKAKPGSLGDLVAKNKELINVNTELQASYDALAKKVDELTRKQTDNTSGTKRQLDAYQQLVKAQKDADAVAKAALLTSGEQSEAYKKAAQSAADYQKQIDEIKAIRKGNPISKDVPFTINLPDDEAAALAATGTAINDLDKLQLEAQQSATAWADAEFLAGEAVQLTADEIIAQGAAIEAYVTALNAAQLTEERELTLLEQVSLAYVSVKTQLAETAAEIKATEAAYDEGLLSKKQYADASVRLAVEEEELKQSLKLTRGELEAQVSGVIKVVGAYELLTKQYKAAEINAKNLAAEYGRDSIAAKEAAAAALAINTELQAIDKTVGLSQRNVGNYGSAFSKAFGSIRSLAAILPGIGIQGIFLAIFSTLPELIIGLFDTAKAFDAVRESIRTYNTVIAGAQQGAEKEIINLKIQEKAITDVNLPMAVRLQAVKDIKQEYPAYLGNISDEALLSGQAATQIDLLSKALFQKAFAEAAANKAAELGIKNLDLQGRARFLVDEQTKAQKELNAAQKEGGASAIAEIGGDANQRLTDAQFHLKQINDILQKNRIEQRFNNVEIERYITAAAQYQGVVQSLDSKGQISKNIVEFKDYLQQLLKAQQDGESLLLQDEIKFRQAVADSDRFGYEERNRQAKKASQLRLQLLEENNKSELAQIANARADALKDIDDKETKAIQDAPAQRNQIAAEAGVARNLAEAAFAQQRLNIIQKSDFALRDEEINTNVELAKLRKEANDKALAEYQQAQRKFREVEENENLSPERLEKARQGIDAFNANIRKANEKSDADDRELSYTKEQTALLRQYNAGRKSKEEYERDKRDLEIKYSKEALDAAIQYSEAEIKLLNKETPAYKALAQSIEEAKQAREALNSKSADNGLADLAEDLENIATITQNLTSAISDLNNIRYDNEKAKLEELEAKQERYYQTQIDGVNRLNLSDVDRAAKLQQIEASRESQRIVNEQKRRAADNKKAQFDKELSILNIITGTAAAVVKALPNIPLAISIGALGAAELVAAVATKVPQYKTGLKHDKPAHFGLHGDVPEWVKKPGEKPFLSTTPVIDWIPTGTRIEPISNEQINRSISSGLHQQSKEIAYNYKHSDQQSKQSDLDRKSAAYNTKQVIKAIGKISKSPIVNVNLQKQMDWLQWKQKRTNW